ncbi:MAG: FkbM family methyltransferase [Bacteroidia bacterium]
MLYYWYIVKLIGVYARLRRQVVAPLGVLLRLCMRQNAFSLRLTRGQSLPALPWNPYNLYGLVGLLEAGYKVQGGSQANTLLWELAPGKFFATRLDTGMDVMTLYEIFGRKDYGEDFAGKYVIDVGAYNGDSAVYFALRGAKAVVALEPHGPNLEWAAKNIASMGLEGVITLLPYALSARAGEGVLQVATDAPYANALVPKGAAAKLFSFTAQEKITLISLGELLDRLGWEKVDFLKLDCEGCEFEIFAHTPEEMLRRVEVFHIEYHAPPKAIEEKLTALGYQVKRFMGRWSFGYLYAYKR